MIGLQTETRARWHQLSPDKFIGSVLYGTLRDKIKLAYMVVNVYTQIVHSQPTTASLRLRTAPAGGPQDVTRLRDLLQHMRACINDANDIIQCDTPTLSSQSYTPEGYILYTIRDIRHYIQHIERWATAIEKDPDMDVTPLPGLNGKRAGDIAAEIMNHISEIMLLLDFAQQYAEGRPSLSKVN